MKQFTSIFILIFFLHCSNNVTSPYSATNHISPDVLNEGLIAYYPFDDDADDHSVNNYNGTEIGNVNYTQGISNGCLYLDGSNSYIKYDIDNSPFPITAYTIVLWIKSPGTENTDSWTARRYIMGSDHTYHDYQFPNLGIFNGIIDLPGVSGISESIGCEIDGSGGGFGFNEGMKDQWIMVTYYFAYGEGPFEEPDYPYHWIILNDNIGGGGLFPDYFKSKNGEILGKIPFYIGSTNDSDLSDSTRFKGCIDEVRIYNRILKENEYKEIYNYYVNKN
ncbi:hypothetical protein JW835_11680 [bacterium]|nr:hypothetical protein [bacterium]